MPTVHRLAAVLTQRGWLDRQAGMRRLRLGVEMARLVPALLAGLQLPSLARPRLTRLAFEVQETVNVPTLQGNAIVYLLSETAERLLTPRVAVGMRLPAHCTALGKCVLAQLPDEVARAPTAISSARSCWSGCSPACPLASTAGRRSRSARRSRRAPGRRRSRRCPDVRAANR